MRFEDELRDPKQLKTRTRGNGSRDKAFSARELEMAEQLIDNMRSEWDPSRYRDTYKDALVKLLEKKAKTGTLPPAPRANPPRADVVDLMALLRKSISEKSTKDSKRSRSRKRAA
jgi:DNA end-binding protein Ku